MHVSLGGGQGGAFGATLDGISVNTNRSGDTTETAFLTPSVEAITEFSVETNGFKPEFGQAGGGAITFASKSGTNKLQGSVYDFLRNDALDEKGFFETHQGRLPAERLRRLARRAGADWPASTTGRTGHSSSRPTKVSSTSRASNATILSVPTPEMYNGDFSNWVDARVRLHPDLRSGDHATQPERHRATFAIRSPATSFRPAASAQSPSSTSRLAKTGGRAQSAERAPGTFGYVSTTIASPGGTTKETTNKYSLKIDHTLSNTQPLLLPVQPGEQRSGSSPATGAAGLPAPFNTFQASSFDADLHRVSWDWVGSRDGQPPDGRHQHVQQECVFAERRPGLEEQGVHQERGRLQPQHGDHHVLRVRARGAVRPTTAPSSRDFRSRTT